MASEEFNGFLSQIDLGMKAAKTITTLLENGSIAKDSNGKLSGGGFQLSQLALDVEDRDYYIGLFEEDRGNGKKVEDVWEKVRKAPQLGMHYHDNEYQYVIVLQGTLVVDFAVGGRRFVKTNEVVNIPPGTVHRFLPINKPKNQTHCRALLITVPAEEEFTTNG